MNKIALIIRREYFSRVKKRSFVVMTLLGPLLIVGFFMLVVFIGTQDNSKHVVGIYDEAGKYVPVQLKNKPDKGITYLRLSEPIGLQEFAEDHPELTEYVDITSKTINGMPVAMYYRDQIPGDKLINDLSEQLAVGFWAYRIQKDSIPLHDSVSVNGQADVQSLLNRYQKVEIKTFDALSEEGEEDMREAAWVGMGFSMLIYFFIFLYGVQVMRGIIEEKTSRIVEVMISSVQPFQLMMGKIIGIALVGLTQFAMWIILTITLITAVSVAMPDLNPGGIHSFEASAQLIDDPRALAAVASQGQNEMFELIFYRIQWPLLIGSFVFYFLFGYMLYGSLFAAVGSAVDSESDTQQFMLPLTIPLLFGLYITIFAMGNPEGDAMVWASMVPFTSPIAMMVRIATGTVGLGELLFSMGILASTFLFTTWVAGRIYRTGILMYGKKASYKELWKWLFYR